jgi:hypothetical protein
MSATLFGNEITVRTYGQAGTRTCYLCCFISHIHNPRVGAQRTMAPLDIRSRSRPIGFTFFLVQMSVLAIHLDI